MDNLFYRKGRKELDIRSLVKKLRKRKRTVLGLLVGIPVLLFLFFGNHGIVQRIRLQSEKAELETRIHQAEEESKRLQAESRALDADKKAIEKVARERHGMVREGETVYRVRKKN